MMRGPRARPSGPDRSGGVMTVSLGMRISGLLVAGAVAVAVAAFTGDGSGPPDGRGGGSSIVTTGPSDGARSSVASEPPALRQSPAGAASGTVVTDSPRHTRGATTPPGTSPSPSRRHSSGNRPLDSPTWLPNGPVSPDADSVPDPAAVYDRLRDPGRCRAALDAIPRSSPDPE